METPHFMIRIIDGKRYNTGTATEIASYYNGLGRSDFHCVEETLYRTPKGAWFLEFWGGSLSEYSRSCGPNSWCGDSGLKALSDDDAYLWLQHHNKTAALETYFADRVTDA
jgi:hypothetical protein